MIVGLVLVFGYLIGPVAAIVLCRCLDAVAGCVERWRVRSGRVSLLAVDTQPWSFAEQVHDG